MSRILFAVLLALLPASAGATTLADLRAEARILALDNGARLRFSTSTIDNWLNEAQTIANIEGHLIRRSLDLELVAGTTYYSLPSDFLQMLRVTLRKQELGETTPEALAGQIGWNWIESAGLPSSYYINFSSRTKLAFYPWPDTSASTGTVHFEYWAAIADMDDATDQPFEGVKELQIYAQALPFQVASQMALLDGRLDLAIFYDREFKEWLERIKREANARPSYRPGMKPGTPLNRMVP